MLDAGDTDVTEDTWDARERLTKVTDYAVEGGPATEVVDYLYDVENHCIGETIDSNGDGQVDHQTRFAYDGNQIVLQFDKDVSGATGSASALTGADLSHRYLWQPDVVDQLLADEQLSPLPPGEGQGEGGSGQATGYDVTTPGKVLWALNDQLGTVRDLATLNGQTGVTTVANHRTYTAVGEMTSQTNAAVDCLFGFTGRALDSATGIQDNWRREYDPKTADWLSKDPLGFTAGDANTGRYVGNRVTALVDPTGLAVGHHWVPRSVFDDASIKPLLTAEAYDIFKYTTSKETFPATLLFHGNDTWNGVTTPQYSAAVKTLLTNYVAAYGKNGVLDDKAGPVFVRWLETGKGVSEAFVAANRAAFNTAFAYNKGFIESIGVAVRAKAVDSTLTQADLKALAETVVNKEKVALSDKALLALNKIQKAGTGLALAGLKIVPALMWGTIALSTGLAAQRGYAGEGHGGDGVGGAFVEISADFFCADLVDAACHRYVDEIANVLMQPEGYITRMRFGDLLKDDLPRPHPSRR